MACNENVTWHFGDRDRDLTLLYDKVWVHCCSRITQQAACFRPQIKPQTLYERWRGSSKCCIPAWPGTMAHAIVLATLPTASRSLAPMQPTLTAAYISRVQGYIVDGIICSCPPSACTSLPSLMELRLLLNLHSAPRSCQECIVVASCLLQTEAAVLTLSISRCRCPTARTAVTINRTTADGVEVFKASGSSFAGFMWDSLFKAYASTAAHVL